MSKLQAKVDYVVHGGSKICYARSSSTGKRSLCAVYLSVHLSISGSSKWEKEEMNKRGRSMEEEIFVANSQLDRGTVIKINDGS